MRHALPAVAALAALALPATASAGFIEEGSFDIFAGGPYDLVSADFNRDGRVDVATFNGDSNSLSVLLRRADGGFDREAGSPFAFGAGASGGGYGTVADFNGDGWPDVALGFLSSHVSVLLRVPSGGFALDAGSPRGQTSQINAVAAGDFNQDARPDLAAVHGNGTISIHLRTAAGDDFLAPAAFPGTGSDPRSAAVADLDGDGDPDLVVSNRGSGTATVYRGGAGGTFSPSGAPIPVGAQPFEVAIADFDGDGRNDFAVASCGDDAISVQLQQPGGGWAPAPGSPVRAGDCPIGLVTADFNFDGRADLASGNQSSGNVTVAVGTSGGRFSPDEGSPIRTESGATSLAVGDFDGDTRQDLAVSSIFLPSDRVTVLLNRTPFPPGPPASPPPPGAVDADGDGVSPPLDCRDDVAAIRPGARDVPGNGVDEDCLAGDAPLPLLKRRITAVTATYPSGYMVFTSMAVKPARKGDRLRLSCKGRGCDFKTRKIRVKKRARRVSLMKLVRGMELRKGAVVQLRVTRAGTIGRVRTWKARAPEIPRIADRCLTPGTTRPGRCPRR